MNDIKPYNFIVVRLGDNDFGNDIRKALIDAINEYDYHKRLCPILFKKYIVNYIIGCNIVHINNLKDDVDDMMTNIQNLHRYLTDGIRVTFEVNRPTYEGIGEDSYLDINLKEVYDC